MKKVGQENTHEDRCKGESEAVDTEKSNPLLASEESFRIFSSLPNANHTTQAIGEPRVSNGQC